MAKMGSINSIDRFIQANSHRINTKDKDFLKNPNISDAEKKILMDEIKTRKIR